MAAAPNFTVRKRVIIDDDDEPAVPLHAPKNSRLHQQGLSAIPRFTTQGGFVRPEVTFAQAAVNPPHPPHNTNERGAVAGRSSFVELKRPSNQPQTNATDRAIIDAFLASLNLPSTIVTSSTQRPNTPGFQSSPFHPSANYRS